MTTTSYSGNTTTVTDPSLNSIRYSYDALNRLVRVEEDPSGLDYLTTYSYDVLGNLTAVNQSGQQRTFTYDSLSRLVQATNPESGTVSYTYDPNGNLATKVDARNITTTYTYDVLNRLQQKSYSDGTSTVTYSYDTKPDGSAISNGLGRLTQVVNGNSATTILSYDPLGEITDSQQVTAGQAYSFHYTYNLMGSLTGETYPSGRVVNTSYDQANRPSALQGVSGGVATNYVGNPSDSSNMIHYWPHGGVYYYNLGNGITHAVSFNPRLQQTESYESVGNSSSNVLFVSCPNWDNTANPLVYDLCPHPANQLNSRNLPKNNGNLLGYDESYGGPGYPQFLHFSQTFSYDTVNRLQTASDSGGWSRTFQYDPFGNMWVTNVSGPATGAPTNNVYGSSNRVANGSYDAAGNVLVANGDALSYDADNHQIAATEPASLGGGTEQYLYDGEGHRVEKIGPSGTTVYVYDAAGQLAAEYSTSQPANSLCATCYLATDHLGSTRLVTDQNGSVVARHDYFPFGEEVLGGSAGRDSSFGFSDAISLKFTGKERDTESGLDYFGARYYGSSMGRMMSPDSGVDQHPEDPQTWNLYSYGRNNPLVFIDPTGEYVCGSGITPSMCDNFQKTLDAAQNGANALKDKYGATSTQYTDAQRAIDAYGKEGVDNGVTLNLKEPTPGNAAAVDPNIGSAPKTADNPLGIRINVNFGHDMFSGDADNAPVAAHEGSHVADGQDWARSGFSPAMDPTRYGTENRAFHVGASVAEGTGWPYYGAIVGGKQIFYWKPGWTPAQVNSGINQVLGSPAGNYHLTPNSKILAFQHNTKGGQ